MVKGVDVGRWVADDPIIALTNPTGLCFWWGLHRLWTLRCQKVVRRMEVDTMMVIMSLGLRSQRRTCGFAIRGRRKRRERHNGRPLGSGNNGNTCWGKTPRCKGRGCSSRKQEWRQPGYRRRKSAALNNSEKKMLNNARGNANRCNEMPGSRCPRSQTNGQER